MSFAQGTRLGPYEILDSIGAGGMGEVYKARDTRLDRIVAVKVLAAHLSRDRELRERFVREARTIAHLNHPHICTLYDVGHQDGPPDAGVDYLVMEYLKGETLAQRLEKGPLPLDHVLRCAIQIADALAKAHREGVTHRDLKPGNIMLTASGAKLLDFGLAKLTNVAAAPVSVSRLPTDPDGLTVQGTIVGTLQYMAPEQIEGRPVDGRSDIFAFGAVVYEMATGKKAFEGQSQAGVIAAILERDPPRIIALQPSTPQTLDRVVRKCLAKEPGRRWQTASDLCDELNWIADSSSTADAPLVTVKGHHPRRRHALLAGGFLAVAIAGGVTIWSQRASSPSIPQTIRFAVMVPANEILANAACPTVALSRDGNLLAYVTTRGGNEHLYLRAMDSLDARAVAGIERRVNSPFFSPDGQWLGFVEDGNLKKVSTSGGAPVTLVRADDCGASWSSDDTIIFRWQKSLFQIPSTGGTPQPLTTVDSGNEYFFPEFLPDGQAVLYTTKPEGASFDDARIIIHRLDTGERRVLVQGGSHAQYVPTGRLVYARAGAVLAVPFDPVRLEVTGRPVSVVEGLRRSSRGSSQFAVSASGSFAYVETGTGQELSRTLVWVDHSGREQAVAAPRRAYLQPRVSSDGRRLVVEIEQGNDHDIWIYDVSRESLTRLTSNGDSHWPAWAPDGTQILFASGPSRDLFLIPSDSSRPAERLTSGEFRHAAGSLSPDGQTLVYSEDHPGAGMDLWVLPVRGDRKPRLFLQTKFNESLPVFSPDGRWLAYVSNDSGRDEVFVQPFPGPGGKWQISTDGGTDAIWAPRGRELYYRNADRIMAVSISTLPSFTASKPRTLFQWQSETRAGGRANFDVAPDGQRLLMIKEGEPADSGPELKVVVNWHEELKRKMPVQ